VVCKNVCFIKLSKYQKRRLFTVIELSNTFFPNTWTRQNNLIANTATTRCTQHEHDHTVVSTKIRRQTGTDNGRSMAADFMQWQYKDSGHDTQSLNDKNIN